MSNRDEIIRHAPIETLKNSQNVIDVTCVTEWHGKTFDLNNCLESGVCPAQWEFGEPSGCQSLTIGPSN